MAMIPAGLAVVVAAEVVEAAAVGVGGDRREEQQDSDGTGEHRRIVLHAREREKPRAGRGSNYTEIRHS